MAFSWFKLWMALDADQFTLKGKRTLVLYPRLQQLSPLWTACWIHFAWSTFVSLDQIWQLATACESEMNLDGAFGHETDHGTHYAERNNISEIHFREKTWKGEGLIMSKPEILIWYNNRGFQHPIPSRLWWQTKVKMLIFHKGCMNNVWTGSRFFSVMSYIVIVSQYFFYFLCYSSFCLLFSPLSLSGCMALSTHCLNW